MKQKSISKFSKTHTVLQKVVLYFIIETSRQNTFYFKHIPVARMFSEIRDKAVSECNGRFLCSVWLRV